MFSRLSNFSGPLSLFSGISNNNNINLKLYLDSLEYDFYGKSFSFDSVDSIGVTYSSNSVTSQTGGGWNDTAISVETIPLGSPFKLKFKRGESLGDIMCGVSQTPPIDNQATYTRSSFGFYLGYGLGGESALSITESGNFSINVVTNGSFPASTVYSIIYDGIRVKYYVNDSLFYTSGSVPTNDLFLYILFLQNDKSITDIEFGGINPIWNDSSGNGNNFNLINTPKYLNGSFNFNDGLTQSAHGDDLGTLNQFTVDTWFKLNSLPSVGENPQIIINTFDGGHPYINFAIGFLNGPPIGNGWDGKISGGFFTDFPNYWKYTDGFTPEIETWYNVTLTYDEVYLKLYLDGTLYSSASCTASAISSGLGIDIGRRWDVPDFTDRGIDVVNIWDGPLSSTQILNNYNSISPRYVFATASIVLNGSSSIDIPAGNEFALGTSYTIEFWSKASISSDGSPMTIMAQRDTNSGIDIFYQNGYLIIRNGVTVTTEPTPGVWTHVAIVSDNTTLSVYYNGVTQSVSGSGGNLSNNTYGLSIGCRGPINNFQYFNGSLWGIRINNTAIYSAGFNPYDVALPPTNITGTVLLVNEYQVSTGNFIDSSYNKTLVNKGATHSTDVPIVYRYLRWVMTQTKGADIISLGAIQASDLVLLYNGATVSWGPSASATNPDGESVPSETADKLLLINDYDIYTKWCDYGFGNTSFGTSSIYIDNVNPIFFNSYYYVTGSDAAYRDPVSWTLAVSNDNTSWVVLSTQSNVVITDDRYASTQTFSI
jgi:hypothetical protein